MKDRRKYMRFGLLLDALWHTGESMKRAKVNDFSRDGIGITSKDCPPEGENIEMELKIPGDNIPVVLTGEIKWTTDSACESKQRKSGVRFKTIDNSDRNRILEHIYKKWITPAKVDKK